MNSLSKHLHIPRPLIRPLAWLLVVAFPLAAQAAEPAAVSVSGASYRLPASLRQVPEQGVMRVRIREGRLMQLPRAAAKVLVADPKVASFQMPSPNSLFVFGESAGTTTLYALDAKDEVIAALRVVSEHNLDALREQITLAVPNSQVELEPSLNDRMVVRGSVRTPQDAKQVIEQVQAYLDANAKASGGGGGGSGSAKSSNVINQLKVELSSQINIQVRVVEVSRSLSRELGFDWATILNTSNGAWGIMTGNSASGFVRQTGELGTSLFDSATGKTFSTLATGTSTAQLAAGGYVTNGNFTVGGLVTALSSNGFASLLAEPNLTAMSGESAAFAAGGEVPVVILTNNNVQIEYKSYGVIMRMTPTLLSANRISLHVAPEVSELSSDGQVTLDGGSIIPAFKVRRADTTVELASGQSFALAGMLRSTNSQTISGIPGLSSIPWVGRLFEHETTESEESELILMVTAQVVDPVSPKVLQAPGRGLPSLGAALPDQGVAGYLY